MFIYVFETNSPTFRNFEQELQDLLYFKIMIDQMLLIDWK